MIIQALQEFARGCIYRISKPVFFLRLALCCTVLCSRWCQSGVKIGIAASRSCSLVARTQSTSSTSSATLDTANPRPLLSLDALYGPQHRRRDVRGVGLGLAKPALAALLKALSLKLVSPAVGSVHRRAHLRRRARARVPLGRCAPWRRSFTSGGRYLVAFFKASREKRSRFASTNPMTRP